MFARSLKPLCLITLTVALRTNLEGSEKDLLTLYTEKLARQEKNLEELYDYDVIVTQHLQHMGMGYENILKMEAADRRYLFHKNLRIWAAFSQVKKYDNLISAQENAIRDTERTLKSLAFDLALEKYRQELINNP